MRTLKYITIYVFAVLFITVSFNGCGHGTGDPVGFDGDSPPVYRVTLSPKTGWYDTYFDMYVPTGKSNRLAVGEFGPYTTRTLLRFDVSDVPKEIDLTSVTSISIRFAYYRVDNDLNDKYFHQADTIIDLHRLTRNFDEDRANWYRADRINNWVEPGGDFGPVLTSMSLGKPENKRTFVRVDVTDLFFDWIENPNTNYGVALTEAITGVDDIIKEFYSLDEDSKEDVPTLEIVYIDEDDAPGEKSYKYVAPEKDCFIILNDDKFDGDTVHGGETHLDYGSFYGYARRTLIKFDLSEKKTGIPADAVILKARMKLFYTPAGRDERMKIAVNRLTEGFNESAPQDELSDIKYDDNYDYIVKEFLFEEPGYTDMYLNPIVQEWLSKKYPNFGFILSAYDETRPNLFPKFSAAQNPSAGEVPHMEVLFTVPNGPWFESTGTSGDGYIIERLSDEEAARVLAENPNIINSTDLR